MRIIVKYKVEKPFTDKYSKEKVKQNDIIEVTVERMKELNAKSAGRVVDVLLVDEESNKESEKPQEDIQNSNLKQKFVREELETMNVNQLKDLAEKNSIELTNVKKQDIIDELMNN